MIVVTKLRCFGFFLLIGLSICSFGCQSPADSADDAPQPLPQFFDLKGYFEKEIERLEQQQVTISKKITLDGQVEQQRLDSINFSEELSVFTKSAINRPAWLDQYRVDSTFQEDKLISIHYEALAEDLKTRHLDIDFDGQGNVQHIKIDNLLKAIIATTQQRLSYTPADGYSIYNKQEVTLSESQEMKIAVTFEE